MRAQRLIGLIMLLVGLTTFVGEYCWFHSRTFVAYNAPVTLKPGRITTGPFKINFEGQYHARISEFEYSVYAGRCPLSYHPKATWLLSGGQTLAQVRDDYELTVSLKPGEYELTVDWREDAGCVDHFKPRLIISTYSGDAEDNLFYVSWIAVFAAVLGTVLCFRGRRSGEVRIPESNLSITGTSSFKSSTLRGLKRPSFRRRKFASIPTFGLIGSIGIVAVMLPLWFLQTINRMSVGIWIRTARPATHQEAEKVANVLVVHLECEQGTRVYVVDTERVSREALPERLKQELAVRSDWTVYFDATSDVDFKEAMDVIDVIRGMRAKVVLLAGRPHTDNGQCSLGPKASKATKKKK